MLCRYYRPDARGTRIRKWWFSNFLFGVNVAATNSYIVHKALCERVEAARVKHLDSIRTTPSRQSYQKNNPKIKPMTHKRFIEALAKDLATQSARTERRKRSAGAPSATAEGADAGEARNQKVQYTRKGTTTPRSGYPRRARNCPILT